MKGENERKKFLWSTSISIPKVHRLRETRQFTRSNRVALMSYEVYVKIGISHSCFCFRAIVVYMVKIVINLSTDNKRNMLIIARPVVSFHLAGATVGEIPISSQIISSSSISLNCADESRHHKRIRRFPDYCICLWMCVYMKKEKLLYIMW